MADVFISYTKPERELTESLASALRQAGLSVWWDSDLLPNDGFRAEVDAQLNACTAVVIIWSAKSSCSYWVLSEADHALKQGKLVNAHHIDILPEELPKPFGQIHAVPITDTDAIIEAVKHLQSADVEVSPVAPTEDRAMVFIGEAIADALKNAPALRELAEREEWENDDSYRDELLLHAEKVFTPLRLFRERLPFAEIESYVGRRRVEHLDEATADAHRALSKEVNWLRSHRDSRAVVEGARGDLRYAVEDLVNSVKVIE